MPDDALERMRARARAVRARAEIEPAKVIVFVDERRLLRLSSRQPIPVRLGPEFLGARAVALVPFEERRFSWGVDEEPSHRLNAVTANGSAHGRAKPGRQRVARSAGAEFVQGRARPEPYATRA
jgi:hypothetical protein